MLINLKHSIPAYFIATVLFCFSSISPIYAAYQPSIGIPTPTFGINETAPSWPAGWPGAQVTNYYYIDNTHPSATDTSNTYGYPNKPRLSIPTTYSAGAYVEIIGGPYTGNQMTITANGTQQNPVWIRGGSSTTKPTIQREIIVNGSYVILENLYFNVSRKTIGFKYLSSTVDHAVLRNSEFAGSGTPDGNTSVIGISGTAGYLTSHIVIYNNVIHDFGNKDRTAAENDYHGILPGEYAEYVWVLNNHIYNMGGDSIQVGQATYTQEQRPQYVYIGGNTFHDDRENAIDIKRANHVVASQNICYGYANSTSSGGEIVVIHNEAAYIWILYNILHTGNYGLITTASTDTYFIGNVIYNIKHFGSWDPNSGYADGAAIHFRGSASTGGAINNTLYNYAIGIQLTQGGANGYDIQNNIFSGRAESLDIDIRVGESDVAAGSIFDYNLFHYNAGDERIYWNASVVNLSMFKLSYNKCLNCIKGDPLFSDAEGNIFTLQPSSPAKDNGISHNVYTIYKDLYGIDIYRDMSGKPRPMGMKWDIGAFEAVTLSPPQNLR